MKFIQTRLLTLDDLPLVYELISQSPTYFGEKASPMLMSNIVGGLIQAKAQTFWGAFSDPSEGKSRLLSMLGQRMIKNSPAWVENLVYLDKQTTGLYNLQSTGFLDILCQAIDTAENEHRYSFFTAYVLKELNTRLKVTQRHLIRRPKHPLNEYVPSRWYLNEGNYLDAHYMLGTNKTEGLGIMQWTKTLPNWISSPRDLST